MDSNGVSFPGKVVKDDDDDYEDDANSADDAMIENTARSSSSNVHLLPSASMQSINLDRVSRVGKGEMEFVLSCPLLEFYITFRINLFLLKMLFVISISGYLNFEQGIDY